MAARPEQSPKRRLPIGAEVQGGGGVHFRVWAPRRRSVVVELRDASNNETLAEVPLPADGGGYFAGLSRDASPGARYGLRLDDEAKLFPDPASRRQPDGPHGLSEIVDPAAFSWHDGDWPGVELAGQVIYEMHIGTFTSEGTWAVAARELAALADLGVTMVEVMPVAEFVGEFGWGYDGVDLFAPTRNYGAPDDFRRFVDEAHARGLAVMLDVVYNHFGPLGNYLGQFSSDYLSPQHHTGWGEAINYDGENSGPVREFFIANAGYWIDEYHVDGLRLDAVHAIVDDSAEHILAAIGRHVRRVAGRRNVLVIAENEFQQSNVMRGLDRGGYGLDAGWNDDFHHAARVAATGHAEHYFADYRGTPQELISLVKWGHLFQGQWNARQKRLRGTPGLDLDAARFVNFLQNHDQLGNLPRGRRLHELTTPGRQRALTALLCLAPGTPLLFQGQEFSASSPFFFFADHEPQLAQSVREGRQAEMRNFTGASGPMPAELFADPEDRRTFERSKLDLSERERHAEAYRLHRDLLRLRREDPVFAAQRGDRIHGAVVAAEAFLLRYLGEDGDDRLVLVNLGRELAWSPAAEPLVVPPEGRTWRLLWSSEDPGYGGSGTPPLWEHHWFVPGHAAFVLTEAPE
jgi:maltooligosyltrehalose trehalohydrolase